MGVYRLGRRGMKEKSTGAKRNDNLSP